MHAGWNALHLACYIGNLEMVKWLIDVCELSPASKDNKGTSPFHTAIVNGNHEIVEFLVEYDGRMKYNRTSYHIAVQGEPGKCKYLFTSVITLSICYCGSAQNLPNLTSNL